MNISLLLPLPTLSPSLPIPLSGPLSSHPFPNPISSPFLLSAPLSLLSLLPNPQSLLIFLLYLSSPSPLFLLPPVARPLLPSNQPEDFTSFMSAVIDEKAFERISSYLDMANSDSALTVLAGGKADKR